MNSANAYNQALYDALVNQMKEVATGKRGWVSLTAGARTCGVPKEQLAVIAKALGLTVQPAHGRHGMTAHLSA